MFRDIKRALDAEDVEGLLEIDTPDDEYNSDASLIEDGIAKATRFGERSISASELEEIVSAVWNKQFQTINCGSA